MNVIALKLVTGEEIIGKVAVEPSAADGGWVLENIRQLQIGMVGQNQLGISTLPWVTSNQDGKIYIALINVVASINPTENIEKSYLEQVTGISLEATKSKKIQLNG